MSAVGATGGPLCHAWIASTFFIKKLLRFLPPAEDGGGSGRRGGLPGVVYDYCGVSRWAGRAGVHKLEELQAVFFPVHFEEDKHWALAALDLQKRQAHFWDSRWCSEGGVGACLGEREKEEKVRAILIGCSQWVDDEVAAANSDNGGAGEGCSQSSSLPLDWTYFIHKASEGVPQQENSCDCGS